MIRISDDGSMYDAIQRKLLMRTGGTIPGLLLHLGRRVEEGFEIIEVWESKDQLDRCNRDVVWPLAAELLGDRATAAPTYSEEFEPRGLVIPAGPTRAT